MTDIYDDQITIFDILAEYEEEEAEPDFREMTIEQIVEYVEDRTGIKFKPKPRWPDGYYTARIGDYKFDIYKSQFNFGDRSPYIGIGYGHLKYHCNAPVTSIKDAVDYFNRRLNERKEEV